MSLEPVLDSHVLLRRKVELLAAQQQHLVRLLTLHARGEGPCCYHCGADGMDHEGAFYSPHGDCGIWTCGRCGLSQLRERPLEADVEALEDTNEIYPTDTDRAEDLVAEHGFMIDLVAQHVPEPGRMLEVGCSHGYKLEAARRRGWEVEGVELLPRACAFVREHFGIPVHQGTLDSFIPSGGFDAVVAWHVLEHVPSIQGFLGHVREFLNPGGFLFVQVPSFEVARKLEWDQHPDVFNALHYWYFTKASLGAVLQEQGFRTEQLHIDPHLPFLTAIATLS